MSNSLWPKGKKSAVMFSFDLDGDIIWQNMSSDEPNSEKLIRARSIGQYGPNRCVDMILDLLDKYKDDFWDAFYSGLFLLLLLGCEIKM